MRFRPRFSLKVLMLFVAAVGIFCAYHVNWIRQRHDFLARNAPPTLQNNGFGYGTVEQTYSRKTQKSSFNFLWLFGEPRKYFVLIAHRVDQKPQTFQTYDLLRMLPKEKCELAERLFPEADFEFQIAWLLRDEEGRTVEELLHSSRFHPRPEKDGP